MRLERVSTRPTMPAMLHERSGPSLGKLKIRGLEIFVIFGNRDFEESEIPRIQKLISLPFPRQRRAGKEAWRVARARGRVFRTRFHMPNHARVAPRPLRSKFGKIENLRFQNFP